MKAFTGLLTKTFLAPCQALYRVLQSSTQLRSHQALYQDSYEAFIQLYTPSKSDTKAQVKALEIY